MRNGGPESHQTNHVQLIEEKKPIIVTADNYFFSYLLDNVCWFYPPERDWSLSWYLSLRGGENFHIYIWILKDLAWAQSWYYAGHFFGIFAIIWSLYLLSHAIKLRNINEIWASTAQTLW